MMLVTSVGVAYSRSSPNLIGARMIAAITTTDSRTNPNLYIIINSEDIATHTYDEIA